MSNFKTFSLTCRDRNLVEELGNYISIFEEHSCTHNMWMWIQVSSTDIGYLNDLSKPRSQALEFNFFTMIPQTIMTYNVHTKCIMLMVGD